MIKTMTYTEFIKSTKVDNSNIKNKIRIKDILNDNWYDFLDNNPDINIRPIVHKEVEKVMECGSLTNGYATYVCKDCDTIKYVPFTCKSRFCSSCGVKSLLDKNIVINKKLLNFPHRHIVFTIPDTLRNLFRIYRVDCFNILFEVINLTLSSIAKGKKKKNFKDKRRKFSQSSNDKIEDYSPGFISCLHTFGRDLKFNPHMHVLMCESALGNSKYSKVYFNYNSLRKTFQYQLLDRLEKKFGKSFFRSFKNKIYSNTKNGFYVYAKKDYSSNTKKITKYIIRYSTRPAIAESRIISYDGNFVTFCYHRHEDNQYIEEKLHVFEFIKRIIIHILPENFNAVRYYGFYCRPTKNYDKFIKLFNETAIKAKKCLNNWRRRIQLYFKIDPLICKSCNKVMTLSSINLKNSKSIIYN